MTRAARWTRASVAFLREVGRSALTAGAGLAACLLLVAVGAVVSLSWQVQPLLCLAAVAVLVWIVIRVGAGVMSNRSSRGATAGHTGRRDPVSPRR